MIYLYSIILYCLTPFVLLRLFILGFRTRAYWSRWGERFGWLPPLEISRTVLWIHAVSVGEVEAAVPLIKRLLAQFQDYQIIITTVTPTGAETVKLRFPDEIIHLYLPYDLPFSVQRYLRQVKPAICLIMETEIWPNLFRYCYQRKVPIVLANARMSLRSFRGYQKVKALTKATLRHASLVIAQSELDADRFVALGCSAEKVTNAGNLKFDIEVPLELIKQAQSLRQDSFPEKPIWIAASTHEKEESQLLDAYEQVVRADNDCLLIIAPRHPQRFDRVAELCRNRGLKVTRRSENLSCTSTTQVFLLDTLGELRLYYACADLAFVGGSLVPVGGHNMLEPASLGVATISGVHVANFQEISRLLVNANALCLVKNSSELAIEVIKLLTDANRRNQMGENGLRLVKDNRGSTDKIVIILQSILV